MEIFLEGAPAGRPTVAVRSQFNMSLWRQGRRLTLCSVSPAYVGSKSLTSWSLCLSLLSGLWAAMTKSYEFNWQKHLPEFMQEGASFDRFDEVKMISDVLLLLQTHILTFYDEEKIYLYCPRRPYWSTQPVFAASLVDSGRGHFLCPVIILHP